MYRREAFREDRAEVMHDLMRACPLGVVITSGPAGLAAAQLPFLIEDCADGLGVLRAHMPRADDQVEALSAAADALVIFQGPSAYVSPGWYPSKLDHGKVVPTWNHVTVHAWGRPAIIDDGDWILAQIERLTRRMEAHRPQPWAVSDAPATYIAALTRGLVGLEIPISRLEGKWKASQNQAETDRMGVIDGLRAEGDLAMAEIVAVRGEG